MFDDMGGGFGKGPMDNFRGGPNMPMMPGSSIGPDVVDGPEMDPALQVVATLPLNWVQLRGPNGSFFVNTASQTIMQDVPPELRQLAQMQQQSQHPSQQLPPQQPQHQQQHPQQLLQQQMQRQQQPQVMQHPMDMQNQMLPPQQRNMQMQLPPQPPPPQSATVKAQLGDWLICEDEQGVFYQDSVTNDTYDNPPPELVGLWAQHQVQQPSLQPPQPPPPPQPQQQQQQRMDSQLYQQQRSPQMPYPGGGFLDPYGMPQAYEHQSI